MNPYRLARRAAGRARRSVARGVEQLKTAHAERRWIAAGLGLPLQENERRLNALRNAEKGKRIFILANGPSLKETDVDCLCNEVTIASNAVFLLFETKRFRPKYYTVED